MTIRQKWLTSNRMFQELNGTALTYNRETTQPTLQFHQVGDTWTESTGTSTSYTASLYIAGGDSDVDNFLKQTYNTQDLEALTLEAKMKIFRETIEDKLINGDNTSNPEEFDGLVNLVDSNRKVDGGDNAITLEDMDELADEPLGPIDLFLMHRAKRRKITSLMRALGSVQYGVDALGMPVMLYGGVPIAVSNVVANDDTAPNSNFVWALRYGPKDLMGLQNQGIQVELWDKLETKDASRIRVKWYLGCALFNIYALCQLHSITNS